MGKKDSHQDAVRRGTEQLRQWGIVTEELSSNSVALLNAHLGKGPETDAAIAFLLGRIPDAAALEALTSLGKKVTDKEVRKEVRRSLFKLAQRGLSAPSERGGISGERRVFKLGPEIEAYLSSVDGAGGRLVWLARPQAGSGIQLLQGMVSDRAGLLRVGGAAVRRKELRRMAQDIKERHAVTMIPIPWEYADQMLVDGFEKARSSGRAGIEQFSSLRAMFNPGKPKASAHPIYDRMPTDEIRSGAWRESSRRLLEEPEFRTWVLDEDWLRPHLEQLQEAQASRLVLNELQKEQRFAAIVRGTVQEIFSGEIGDLFQRRMEDMALYLVATRREEAAKLALAVALQLREGSLGALDISFLTGLVQKSLAFYLSQAKAKAAEEPSLIVKP